MVHAAPRIDARLLAALARLDDRAVPIAETNRRLGAVADGLRVPRPSYEAIRRLVHLLRRRGGAPATGEVLLAIAFRLRLPHALGGRLVGALRPLRSRPPPSREEGRPPVGVRSAVVAEATYFVQIAEPGEPDRWQTIARVEGRALADEVVRLAQGSYMRATVIDHYLARAVSRTRLRREGRLAHADWELGMGEHRAYGRALVERARANLAASRPRRERLR